MNTTTTAACPEQGCDRIAEHTGHHLVRCRLAGCTGPLAHAGSCRHRMYAHIEWADDDAPQVGDRCACGRRSDVVAEAVAGGLIAVCWDCHEPERGMDR